MFVRSKKTRPHKAVAPAQAGAPFAFLAALLFPLAVLAAPHADPKLVDLWSRMDEFHAARGVQRPAAPRELKRAPSPEVEALVDAFLEKNPNTGLIVLKDGAILAERYQYERTAGHRFASASVAKTVLAMLVGIAVQERKITSLDHLAGYYVPRMRGQPYAEITIRYLLTMSSGLVAREELDGKRSPDSKILANTLGRVTDGGLDTIKAFEWRVAPAGTKFRYASADSQALSFVLATATHTKIADYLSEKIWQPMGAEANATWLLDKSGNELGFCCLNAVLRDYARFGVLLANYGALDGKQIIPAEWVKAAITPQAPHLAVGTATRNNGYGYQTWITHKTEPRFAALGQHGQAIFVDPVSKIVVVHTAVWADGDDRAARGAQFRLLEAIHSKLAKQ